MGSGVGILKRCIHTLLTLTRGHSTTLRDATLNGQQQAYAVWGRSARAKHASLLSTRRAARLPILLDCQTPTWSTERNPFFCLPKFLRIHNRSRRECTTYASEVYHATRHTILLLVSTMPTMSTIVYEYVAFH